METLSLLDELEASLTSSRRLPLWGRRLVDEETLWDIVDRLRAAIPANIREADQLISQRDQFLQAAREEARRILTSADEEAQNRLRESRLMREAEEKAREILREATGKAAALQIEAEAQATRRKREADLYTLEVLRRLSGQLDSFLSSIRKGIEVLEAETAEAELTPRQRAS